MTAVGLGTAAAQDVGKIVAVAGQMKNMLTQINSLQAQAREMGNQAKAKLAGAAQATTGGTGTGQILQTRVGQSQIKLDELAKVLQHAASMCDGIGHHASGVEADIKSWVGSIAR